MFAWHKEDLDLCSINFLHFGKPKFWYSIQPQYAERFENFVKTHFYEPFTHCPEFLRHKSTLISPKVLKNVGIPIEKAI